MFTYTLQRASVTALACLSFSFSAFASAASDDLVLDPISVSASRIDAVTDSLPLGTLVLDRETLDAIPGRFLSDALDTVAGVQVRRLGDVGDRGSSVDMLGFGAAGPLNTLILLDGRRLNTVDLSAADLSAIPLSAVERIEVLPAGGAVLYGNGAVGGAINIVTRERHEDSLEAKIEGGEYDTLGGSLSAGVAGREQSAFGALRYLETDGYRENNALEQRNVFANWRGGRHNGYSVSVLADRQRTGLAGARRVAPGVNELENDPDGTSTPDDWAEQEGIHVLPGLRTTLANDLVLQIDGSARWRKQRATLASWFTHTDADLRSFSLAPRLLGENALLGVQHEWMFGLEFQDVSFERADSMTENDDPIHQVEIDQQIVGVWFLDTVPLGDASLLTVGARQEWIETRGRDDYDPSAPSFCTGCDTQAAPLDLHQDAAMFSLGLRHAFSEFVSGFANVERSARYGSVDETFEGTFNPATFGMDYRLEALDVQTGTMFSTGLSWKKQRQFSTLTLWRGDFDDEIHYSPAAQENINLDPTRRYGASLNSEWALDEKLRLTVGASWQHARFRDGVYEGNDVPLVPRQTGYARFDWQARDWLGVSLAHRYVGKRYFDNDQANDFGQRMPSWRMTDLELRFQRRALFAEVGIYNLENNVVYDYGVRSTFSADTYNAYPLPERHVMGSVGVRL